MLVISKDKLSVCNTFDFILVPSSYDPDVFEITNKLDGNVYGTYLERDCKQILRRFIDSYRCGKAVFEFPEMCY